MRISEFERRADLRGSLARLMGDSTARYVLVSGRLIGWRGGHVGLVPADVLAEVMADVADSAGPDAPAGAAEAADSARAGRPVAFLGVSAGVPLLSVDVGPGPDFSEIERKTGVEMLPLREVGGRLDAVELEVANTAMGLAQWRENTRFCPQCGKPLRYEQAGWVAVCELGHHNFPRMDPAVIMAITDAKGRILLGRNVAWTSGMYSVLAGYVEPGESFEQAVRREVKEEVGVEVGVVEYVTTQPWPFPRSIMIGYRGKTVENSPAVVADGEELVDAAFFTRAEVESMYAKDRRLLPPQLSLARKLIEGWYGGPLGAPKEGAA